MSAVLSFGFGNGRKRKKENHRTFRPHPPLSWDNPGEANILRAIEEAFGPEIAEMATMPKEQFLQELCELMLLNNPHETDRDDEEYNPYKPYEY